MADHPPALAALPPQPTTFLGRRAELVDLGLLLTDPACRLVTITGPGGTGKTRLAVEVAAQFRAAFQDGVAFVALQAIPSGELLAAAIAEAVGHHLSGKDETGVQLLNYLRSRELLLVLDNFEHLLEGADLLGDLLTAAPKVRLLVTSREALKLQEEWRYPLSGLAVPDEGQADSREPGEAALLFAERARRVRRDFALEDEREAVDRICRLVEGLPLALELAAGWTRTLPCAAIADEIARNLAFLATDGRNVPERHRSVRAAFEHCWARLGDDERAAFARLSAFRGGFRRGAAERIAGAQLAILAVLLDKSLLRYEADGRYYLHELLRQYAEEQLRDDPEEEARVQRAHGAYYLAFLAARMEALSGGGQQEAQAAVAIELENIRVAWRRVGDWSDEQTLGRAAHTLALYYRFRGPCQEGLAIFERSVRLRRAGTDPARADPVLAAMLIDFARLAIQAGRLAQARAALEEGQALYDRLAIPPPPGLATDPLLWFGVLAMHAGDYVEAARLGQEARRRGEAQRHERNLPYAWWLISRAALAEGQYESALLAAQRACAGAQATENRWYLAYCLRQLGNVASAMGDHAAARQHYQASYTISEEFADLGGVALVLTHLTQVAARLEDHAEARRLYERSRALYRDIGDDTGLAGALHGLGTTALAVGDSERARDHFAQALRLATEIRFVTLTPRILAGIAELFLHAGQPGRAAELLALVGQDPSSDRETHDRAARLLDRAATALLPEALAAATRRGAAGDLDGVVASLQVELVTPLLQAAGSAPEHVDPPERLFPAAAPAQALPEPLTERELDVLRLIAAGRTNQQIADELFLTVNTVKSYAGQVYGKLQVRSRTQAIVRARELRLLV